MPPRMTALKIREMKGRERIPVVTCYDYTMARLCEAAGIPLLLVGDSLGNVILGYETTVRVRLAEMLHHTLAVMRARPHALVVVDMPFLTFQVSPRKALAAAGRIVQETGADAVNSRGRAQPRGRATHGGGRIPVMGHLGLTPQSVLEFGGHPVRGRGAAGEKLLQDARELEEAGCFSLVLEKIPAPSAAESAKRCASRPSASARAPAATDRCSCSMTSWASTPRFTRGS